MEHRRSYRLPAGGLELKVLLVALIALLVTAVGEPPIWGQAIDQYTVTSLGDGADVNPGDGICQDASDGCTVRAALVEANADAGLTRIVFNVAGTIAVSQPLPPITAPIAIDGIANGLGTCATDYAPPSLQVVLAGGGTAAGAHGLALMPGSDTSVIKGLVINGFGGSGLMIASNSNEVQCSIIGLHADGLTAAPNGGDGILINNSARNLVGGSTTAARNIIAANGGSGVSVLTGAPEEEGALLFAADEPSGELPVAAAAENQILGNYIGTNAAGTVDRGNDGSGVQIAGTGVDALGELVISEQNVVGAPNDGNLIAGNAGNGVALVEGAQRNRVQSNTIGLNVVGTTSLANDLAGVMVENSAENEVADNLISGNLANGVMIADPPSSIAAENNLVRGNIIGLDRSGTRAIPNAGAGIGLQNASYNQIGGAEAGYGNVISGNGGDGVIVQRSPGFEARANRIEANVIGPNLAVNAAVGNGGSGVAMLYGQETVVHNNVIGGNGAGITMGAPGTDSNVLTGNFIGTDRTETHAFGNGEHGIFINSRANNNVVGAPRDVACDPLDTFPGRNVVAFHSGRGIWVTAVGTEGNTIRCNRIYANQGDEIENKLGIDLAPSGPNPNDLGDPDRGPNLLQNYPDLLGVYQMPDGRYVINGLLNSLPNSSFVIDVYTNSECDGSGYGEGKTFYQTFDLTTDQFGHAGFSIPMTQFDPQPEIAFVTLMATDDRGNSSEFSRCVAIDRAFVVNTTDDSDDGACTLAHCSLREAINGANASDIDTIAFGIREGEGYTTGGPYSIRPASQLPALTRPVLVDGLSQPGAMCPSTVAAPIPLSPLDHNSDLALLTGLTAAAVEATADTEPPPVAPPSLMVNLDGNGASGDGVVMQGGGSTLRGLSITNFQGNGIVLETAGGNQVYCSAVGLAADGVTAGGNGASGLLVDNTPDNIIGRDFAPVSAASDPLPVAGQAYRNLFGANGLHGIAVVGSSAAGNVIFDNFVGADVGGLVAQGNRGHGIFIDGSPETTVGAVSVGAGESNPHFNLIMGNQGDGVHVANTAAAVRGNFIGTDINGTLVAGNGGSGIRLDASTGEVSANLVSGNVGQGISLTDVAQLLVQDNYIGTDRWRIAPLANAGSGIRVVGGLAAQLIRNVIAFNGIDGITLADTAGVPPVAPLQFEAADNAIYANANLGLDLNDDGVTPNDEGDLDDGPNRLQNYPEIASVTGDESSTSVAGSLNTGEGDFTLRFFASIVCDDSGHGEGQIFLGEQAVSGSGDIPFSATLDKFVPDNLIVTATATDGGGNTSEFSACGEAPPAFADVQINPVNSLRSGLPATIVTYELTVTNLGNGKDSFQLEIGANSSGWDASLSAESTGTLAPNFSSSVLVAVTIPVGATVDQANLLAVTARSTADPAAVATASLTTRVDQFADVALSPALVAKSGRNGEAVSYALTVENLGNGPDSFTVDAISAWDIDLVPDAAIELPIGGTATLEVLVIVPLDAVGESTEQSLISVASAWDESVGAQATLETKTLVSESVALQAAATERTGAPGEEILYQLSVVNDGNVPARFIIAAMGDWSPATSKIETELLEPGGETTFSASVIVPTTALPDQVGVATVSAAAQHDAAVKASIQIATRVRRTVALALDPALQSKVDSAGATVTYELVLVNEGNAADTFIVTVAGPWVEPPAVSSLELAAGASTKLAIEIVIPTDVTGGTQNEDTVTVTSVYDPEVRGTARLETIVSPASGPLLEAELQAATSESGGSATYQLKVRNVGDLPDSFDLMTSGEWPATLSQAATGELAPGEYVDVTLTVAVPPEAVPDQEVVTVVTATSRRTSQSMSLNFLTQVVTGEGRRVTINVLPVVAFRDPNGKARYQLRVTNAGSISDAYAITVAGIWPAELSHATTDLLQPGETQAVTLIVGIPEDAQLAAVDVHTVTARSLRDPAVAAETQVTTINARRVFLPTITR